MQQPSQNPLPTPELVVSRPHADSHEYGSTISHQHPPSTPPTSYAKTVPIVASASQPGELTPSPPRRRGDRISTIRARSISPATSVSTVGSEANERNRDIFDDLAGRSGLVRSALKLVMDAPLLLRSSPAAGTGSYGAAPPYDPDEFGVTRRNRKRRNSTRLSKMTSRSSGIPTDDSDEDSVGLNDADTSAKRPHSSGGSSTNTGDELELDGNPDATDGSDTPIEDSPYAQVRASVSPTDDLTLSISTPRMWTLSMLFAFFGSASSLFFSLRYPSVSITPVIALLLVHPLGLFWDIIFKRHDDGLEEDETNGSLQGDVYKMSAGRWEKFRRWMGRGRWNKKEHCCVYIASNVSFGFAFATDVIVEQTHFYNQDPGIVYQLLLTLSTQILGYAFAGLTRRWLVYPASMIWPATLMSTAMFQTLHSEENKPAENNWRISRWKFFLIVFIGGFLWYFMPGLLAPCLSYFNAITWFAPNSVVIANLFGVSSGLGLFPVTFDWAQIAYIGSPLMTPWWAAVNVVGGLVVVMWVVAPIMYYKNYFFSSYMPILSSAVFDNTGKVYDVSKILTDDFLFDREKYKAYSKVFLPITYVLSYGVQFAALTSLVTHTICWHGRDIVRQWSASRRAGKAPSYTPVASEPGLRKRRSSMSDAEWDAMVGGEDIHMRLMRKYPEAPATWYLMTSIVMTAVGIFVVEYYPVHLPWYGLLVALGICTVLFVPIGIVNAITNQQSSIYLYCQLLCGWIFPGRPVANMVFVTYGYITSTQGLKFASDLKLGHYMKIPPRILFSVQMSATIIAAVTQVGVLNWMFANIPHICTPEAMNGFNCPIARVHFNGSILWGVIGPGKFFGSEGMYQPLVWAFAVGAICPVIVWLIGRKRGRHSLWRKVNLPVIFGSLSWIPPATGLNFSAWVITGFVFNRLIRQRAPKWWAKYTMTLSAALDSSLAFGLIVVFFGFVYPGFSKGIKWWGTEVYKQGCDWQACPYQTVPEGGHFGPDTW